MKRLFFKITILSIIFIYITNSFVATALNESPKGRLIINYGDEVTSNSAVTINLLLDGISAENITAVQFSTDNSVWIGFNSSTKQWVKNYEGIIQEFYTNFEIGSTEGLRLIYARLKDNQGNYITATGSINYSPSNLAPYIEGITSKDIAFSNKALKQSGESFNPFVISKNNTTLTLHTKNTHEISYSVDGGPWTPWTQVKESTTNLNIAFDEIEGTKVVYIRNRNKYGIEGNVFQAYYLLDKTKPQIEVSSDFHSIISVDGRIEFDLSLYDRQSKYIDYTVEVHIDKRMVSQEGRVKMYIDDKATTTSITINNVPNVETVVKIIALDEAGNKETKTLNVPSF